MKIKSLYKDTLHLPKTDFPMRANLAQREVAQLAEWEASGLEAQLQAQSAGREKYILHDGPPYANGHIHIGHALNKILKDIIVKSRSLSGYAAPYVPGWDCHGLPIEHQVLKNLGPKKHELSKLEIRKLCRDYAQKFVAIQKEEFKRLGVGGDWAHPYLTMTSDYEATIVREFGKVVATGGVYKGKKPVLWCAFDETALAEAEVEYADKVSPSIYVKFRVKDVKGLFPTDGERETFVVIWTTTPWTLLANQAICLHPGLKYRAVNTPAGRLIVAQDLVEQSMEAFGFEAEAYEICEPALLGSALEGLVCRHPWIDRDAPLILGTHVTLEQGTGCVHTAPGHGQEDYEVGLKYGLEVYAPVDHRGRFTEEARGFGGQKVRDANEQVVETLKKHDALLAAEEINHSYPHCWRCKKPVIFRATEQWFISMAENDLRDRAIKAIETDVRWIPKWGKDRILGMIENRPDWCISRQRVWGVPIVAFACSGCGSSLCTQEIANRVADQMAAEGGSDIWYAKTAAELLPEKTSCPKCGGIAFEQEQDILDVWFESGVSHAAVLKQRPDLAWPADLYLEGSDQHRGWFHSTMLAALMTDGQVPYKAVLTHGFVVDGAGKKMSKSVGNVVAPQEVIKAHGADILRLWVAATDFREDVRISKDILVQMVEAYRKIRNTCRFLLGNLEDYPEDGSPLSEGDFQEIDRWMLDRLHRINEKVQGAYRESSFHVVFHTLNHFCAVDLSSFYLDILKDRLYVSAKNAPERRAAQAVMQEALLTLVGLMAPILSFTAEEIWQHLPPGLKSKPSVHLSSFFPIKKQNESEADEKKTFSGKWDKLIRVREEVSRVLEQARKDKQIGSSLEAAVRLYAEEKSWATDAVEGYSYFALFEQQKAFLPNLLIVSQVDLLPLSEKKKDLTTVTINGETLGIEVIPARGEKCERCWVFNEDVGTDTQHPTLCGRCAKVMLAEGPDAA